MIFVSIFFHKIGKNPLRFLMPFLLHLVLLHVSLVFTQLVNNELDVVKRLCDAFSYVSYYSLVACFVWLYVLCDDAWHDLALYQKSHDVAYDELMQTSFIEDQVNRFWAYKLWGILVPLVTSIIEFVISEFALKSREFSWTIIRVNKMSLEFFCVFYPIIIFMIFGVFMFLKTALLIRQTISSSREKITQDRFVLIKKRFVLLFLLEYKNIFNFLGSVHV